MHPFLISYNLREMEQTLTEMVFPMVVLNPDRVHNFGGSLYLEQKFQVEILSGSLRFGWCGYSQYYTNYFG